jgi:hypothetical protein
MADVVIAQREVYIEGPRASLDIFKNLGRFENLTFYGTISAVEVSGDDGTTWVNITAAGTAISGLIFFKGVSFKWYRVTGSTPIRVTAN